MLTENDWKAGNGVIKYPGLNPKMKLKIISIGFSLKEKKNLEQIHIQVGFKNSKLDARYWGGSRGGREGRPPRTKAHF